MRSLSASIRSLKRVVLVGRGVGRAASRSVCRDTCAGPHPRNGRLFSSGVSNVNSASVPVSHADTDAGLLPPEPAQSWGAVVDYFSIQTDGTIEFGDYEAISSQRDTPSGRVFTHCKDMGSPTGPKAGQLVWIRARVASVRNTGNACFIVLRSGASYTLQACHFKEKSSAGNSASAATEESSKAMLKFLKNIALESIVDICGVVAPANVKSCTQNSVEIQIRKVFAVSRARTVLPFLLDDAARSQADIDATAGSDRPLQGVSQDIRLNNRWLDLRVPANNAIMRIRSGVSQLFREALLQQDFIEINSPKLIGGESEGGANAFHADYFGRDACLAQSPQLYKQMAISSDLERVFEIGPVFRAENSNTRRHLCEFTGLDIEMSITEHYNEVLEVIHRTFKHIFDGLEKRYARELSIVRLQYPSQPVQFTASPCIIHWHDGMKMLEESGETVDLYEDLTGAMELKLGQLVKAKFGTDFFILDQYPANIRPFYTMRSPTNPKFSNSYDIFIRGQEICSGAQRCHSADLLEKQILAQGMRLESLKYYVESFRAGVSPHAGAGIGLDRVVFLYLGLDNIRKSNMFPRDPSRLVP